MNGIPGLFPNSTPTGDSIPFDLLFPTALGVVDFTTAVSASITLPTNAVLLSLRSTEDCIVRFGAAASVPVTGTFVTDEVYVQVDEIVNIVAPAATFTVIGEFATGRLTIQVSQPWTALKVSADRHNR